MEFLLIARDNLLSPMVLCFVLGLGAALVRSELSVPEAAARIMSIYLLFAIGFKGGVEVSRHGFGPDIAIAIALGVGLSLLMPLLAFAMMRRTTGLSVVDAAAAAGHYGSISIVTFVAATQALNAAGLAYDGYMVAVAAAMEAPAIVIALWIAARHRQPSANDPSAASRSARPGASAIPREVFVNGSIILLCGAFVIGWASGDSGYQSISGFIETPFKGVLCLFLLDMGLLAGRYLRDGIGQLGLPVIAVGFYMPLVGAAIAAPLAMMAGLSVGSAALLTTLAASASYIAVPAALRIALPEANPAIYLTLSLGLTFPFNLAIGIPIYIAVAQALN